MTREQDLYAASTEYGSSEWKSKTEVAQAFRQGALWADTNPIDKQKEDLMSVWMIQRTIALDEAKNALAKLEIAMDALKQMEAFIPARDAIKKIGEMDKKPL